MRICCIAYTFYESDTRVRMYAEALAQRGDHVEVMALKEDSQVRYRLLKGVHVYGIQTRRPNERGKADYLYRLIEFLIRSAFLLTKRSIRNPYNVVHIHSVPDFEVFAAFFAKMMGAKVILDIHDILPEFYSSKFNVDPKSIAFRILLWLEKASTAFADHVIVANHLWKQKLIQRSTRENKCTAILNYPDASIFFRRGNLRLNRRFLIVYPGTLNNHQGVDIAIRSFARICDQVPHVEFHIYGAGGMKEYLVELTRKLGLQNRIIFKGWCSAEKIGEIIAEADLGVVPKRNGSFGGEAFSTKILEFMAAGVPVIVSATKIDRYYFNDAVVRFFEPESEADLAEKMLGLINDDEERARLAAKADEFLENYKWENRKYEYFRLVDGLAETAKNLQ